jgi:hypothetical protein
MPNELLASLRCLSDSELVAALKTFTVRERDAIVHVVAHLAELDTRDIHLREGHPSLFVYCRDVLGLSEHEAYNRIEAARAARRFPVILDRLAEGALNLTAVRLLAPHLTPGNHREVLESARGKRKAVVEEIVARLAPRPDVAPVIRKLPTPRPAPTPAVASDLVAPVVPALPISSSPPPAPPAVTPLSPERYRLQCTIGGDTLEKLRLAKDMLRHAVPSGDDAAILDRALSALLADLARKKFAATDRPRPSSGTAPGSRHIPAEVRRAVWLRDLGRCAFLGTNGHRCRERAFLEFHHVQPYEVGGEATVPNVQLRCRRHNVHEARVYFGPARAYVGGGFAGGEARLVPDRVRT